MRLVHILIGLSLGLPIPAVAAPDTTPRTGTIGKGGTFACISWAAWHEFTLASLTARGARYGKACPIRLKAGQRVEIVEEDAGGGATAVKARGKTWYVDAAKVEAEAERP